MNWHISIQSIKNLIDVTTRRNGYKFSHDLKDEMSDSIEENVVKDIPREYLEAILELALDEKFAGSFFRSREKHFSGLNSEVLLQLRLWNFLNEKQMIF